MNDKIKHVTDSDFEKVTTQRGVTLVDVWADWCGPCRQLSNVMDELAEDYGTIAQICKLNADQNSGTTSKLGIRGLPTVLIYKDGKVVQTLVGLQSRSTYEDAIERALKG